MLDVTFVDTVRVGATYNGKKAFIHGHTDKHYDLVKQTNAMIADVIEDPTFTRSPLQINHSTISRPYEDANHLGACSSGHPFHCPQGIRGYPCVPVVCGLT